MNYPISSILFSPGANLANTNITIPTWASDIGYVIGGEIWRLPSSVSIDDHDALSHTGTAVANHAAHSHANTLSTAALQGADLAAVQADHATAARHTLTNANAAEMTHTVTDPNNHAAQSHTVTGADYVVSCTVTRVSARVIKLNVQTYDGDILKLNYISNLSYQKAV